MSRFDLANVHNHAQQVVCARALQLHIFAAIATPNPGRVRKHVELKRELDNIVYLGRGAVVSALFVLETLEIRICERATATRGEKSGLLTLSCIDSTFGKRLMLVYLLACCEEAQLWQRYSHLSNLTYSSSRQSVSVKTGAFCPVFLIRL